MAPDGGRPLPLAGCRVALTGAAGRDAGLAEAISAAGGVAREYPLIAFEPPVAGGPLDVALAELHRYDWILFTSATAPAFVAERLAASAGTLPLPRLAAIGPSTARAVAARLGTPDIVAATHTARDMARELLAAGVGGRLLFPAADIASSDLADGLRAGGAEVHMVTAYRTVAGEGGARLADAVKDGAVDVVLLASPSAARGLADALASGRQRSTGGHLPAIACIGPATAAEAGAIGFAVAAVAADHTRDGLLRALVGWFEHHSGSSHASV